MKEGSRATVSRPQKESKEMSSSLDGRCTSGIRNSWIQEIAKNPFPNSTTGSFGDLRSRPKLLVSEPTLSHNILEMRGASNL